MELEAAVANRHQRRLGTLAGILHQHRAVARGAACQRQHRLAVEEPGVSLGIDAGQLEQRRQDVEGGDRGRSEEHTSELQSLMRISYAVFCLKKKKNETGDKTS